VIHPKILILNRFLKWKLAVAPNYQFGSANAYFHGTEEVAPFGTNFTLDVLDTSLCPFLSPERRQNDFPLIPAT